MKIGDTCLVVDGIGNKFLTKIVVPHQKKTELEIVEKEFLPQNNTLHLAVAPTKNIDRFEWMLEKATEIGVRKITPLLCDNSERKIIKPERLQKILISAMKQSQTLHLPELAPLTLFKNFVESCTEEQKFIAHCENEQKIYLGDTIDCSKNVIVLIGPEGDFSTEEIELAKKTFTPVSLGDNRLRTETAGVYSAGIYSFRKNLTY